MAIATVERADPEIEYLSDEYEATLRDLYDGAAIARIFATLIRLLGDFDLAALFRDGLKPLTPNGVIGDPRDATAELGNDLLASRRLPPLLPL